MICSTPWILENEENFPELETAFLSNPYPSRAQIEELAQRTKFQEEHIDTYFSIRRGDISPKPSIMAQNSEKVQKSKALTKQGLNQLSVFQRCMPRKQEKSLEAELGDVEEVDTLRIRLATSEVSRKILGAELHRKVQEYEIQLSEARNADEMKQERVDFLESEMERLGKMVDSYQKCLEGVDEELKEKDTMYLKEIGELIETVDQKQAEIEELKIGHAHVLQYKEMKIGGLKASLRSREAMNAAKAKAQTDLEILATKNLLEGLKKQFMDEELQSSAPGLLFVEHPKKEPTKLQEDKLNKFVEPTVPETTVDQKLDTVVGQPIVVVHPLAMLDVQEADTVLVDTVFEGIQKLDVQAVQGTVGEESDDDFVMVNVELDVQADNRDTVEDGSTVIQDTVVSTAEDL